MLNNADDNGDGCVSRGTESMAFHRELATLTRALYPRGYAATEAGCAARLGLGECLDLQALRSLVECRAPLLQLT